MLKKCALFVLIVSICMGGEIYAKNKDAKIYVLKTPEGDVLYTNHLDMKSGRKTHADKYVRKISYTTFSVRPHQSYREAIYRWSRKYGVDPYLVIALITVESGFRQSAVSPKGAVGLMQIMPETARILGVNPHDPYENIEGGIRHLANLIGKYQDIKLALAAYNAGQRAVDQYQGIPPYPETRNYVKMVLRLYQRRSFIVYRYRTKDGVLHISNKKPSAIGGIPVEQINMRDLYAPGLSIAGGFKKE